MCLHSQSRPLLEGSGMVGASKLSELIYGNKEVASSNDISSLPPVSTPSCTATDFGAVKNTGSMSRRKCCNSSSHHRVSRCHGTRTCQEGSLLHHQLFEGKHTVLKVFSTFSHQHFPFFQPLVFFFHLSLPFAFSSLPFLFPCSLHLF